MIAGSKKEDSPDLKAMMTLSEVSNCLSLSAASVCRIAGELKAIRVAGRWRFRMSDVEQWLLKARPADELPIEPVEDLGSHVRLVPHLEEANVFLDVPESEAPALIRNAIHRAHQEAQQRICIRDKTDMLRHHHWLAGPPREHKGRDIRRIERIMDHDHIGGGHFAADGAQRAEARNGKRHAKKMLGPVPGA